MSLTQGIIVDQTVNKSTIIATHLTHPSPFTRFIEKKEEEKNIEL